ncbi:MAG: cytochrome c oxidase subunit II [Deltaproteobacteria bacterium RBG_16_54_18]|nr:MAG: cytochrome c oxidase subunit II [Deltaproteobacteria bacterium RBG_16_54_18]
MFFGPSNTSGKIEVSFLILTGISVLFLVLVTFFIILFLIKYNKKRHPRAQEVRESLLLEIVWTVIPTALVLALFYFGWKDFDYIRNPPKNAMPVTVIGRQWSWLFEYENGRESDVLRVPVGKPIRLILTSKDVIHSFFVPAFQIKEDCVPGMETHLWFTVNETGSYDIFCTEYCGVGHSHMRSKVVAVPPAEFAAWYVAKAAAQKPEERGLKLLLAKGCLGCHSIDGTQREGPTLKGLYNRRVTVRENGKEKKIVADEAYLRTSILKPAFDVVKGYQPIMPATPLTPEELQTVVDYLKGLK